MELRPELDELMDSYRTRPISRRTFVERALKLGLSVPAAAALLAACGSSDDDDASGTTSSTSAAPGDLKGRVQILVGFGTGNAPAQVPVQETLARAFMTANPGVTIEFLRSPGSGDARTKLTTLIAGGEPPDIVMPAGLYGVSLFVDQNVWLDLGPLAARDGVSLDAFVPETVPATRVTNYFGTDSKHIIGLPVGVHDHALAYNVGLFSKAGVAPPPTDWTDATWSLEGRFLDAARALTVDGAGRNPGDPGFDAGGITQFGVGHFFREGVFYGFGGHLYDPASRTAQFATPESVAGIQFAADLVKRHKVQPGPTEVASLGAGASKGSEEQFAWRAGKLAMIDMCSCDIKSPFGTDVPFEWRAAAMPTGPKRRFGFLNLDVGALVRAGKNQEAAWQVLKYFAVDPATEATLAYESYGAVPPLAVNRDAFVTGIRADLPSVDPQVWIAGFPSASPENESWFPAFAEVNDLIGKSFDQIVGGTPAAQAMPMLQAQAQAKIDEWFRTNNLPS
ncbi:MAG: extracellular solute-binding protein [Acidimicrobiales bacterium]